MQQVISRGQLAVGRANVFEQHQIVVFRKISQGNHDPAAGLDLELEPARLIERGEAFSGAGLLDSKTILKNEG
jgi:hypothetical protein